MKYYYSISEVAKLVDIKPYVLRYWEGEFKELHPKKTKSGRRTYTQKEIDLISSIKELLYKEKYSVKGVRNKLKNSNEASLCAKTSTETRNNEYILNEIEQGLKEMLNILKG